jgi:hypothetical protein
LLPKHASNKNFWLRVCMSTGERETSDAHTSGPARSATLGNACANQWQRDLDSGAVRSRAELARCEGVSRAYVTQVLGPQPLPTKRRVGR